VSCTEAFATAGLYWRRRPRDHQPARGYWLAAGARRLRRSGRTSPKDRSVCCNSANAAGSSGNKGVRSTVTVCPPATPWSVVQWLTFVQPGAPTFLMSRSKAIKAGIVVVTGFVGQAQPVQSRRIDYRRLQLGIVFTPFAESLSTVAAVPVPPVKLSSAVAGIGTQVRAAAAVVDDRPAGQRAGFEVSRIKLAERPHSRAPCRRSGSPLSSRS